MIKSKVIRDNRRHITRADYGSNPVSLSCENIRFPNFGSLQARALRRLLPVGVTLSHRGFDFESHSYRLGSYIDYLREKGWTIINHDELALTRDKVPRKAKFTRYELFAKFTPKLKKRVNDFCKAVDRFEAEAIATASNK